MANIYVNRGADTIPATGTGDTLIFLGGNASVVNGLDLSGIDVANVIVSSDFNAQIGTEGCPLKARVTTKINYGPQGGDLYFQSMGSGGAVSTLLYVFGEGHFHFGNSGTLTRAEIASGQLTIDLPCVGTNVRLAGGILELRGVAGTGPTLLKNMGGYCYTERGGTTLEHGGGTTKVQAGTNTIGTFTIDGPGVELVECGTITQLNLYGGVPDMRKLARRLTITNCNINMTLPGAQAFLDHEALTFTNTPVRMFTDGSLPTY